MNQLTIVSSLPKYLMASFVMNKSADHDDCQIRYERLLLARIHMVRMVQQLRLYFFLRATLFIILTLARII